MTCGPCTARVQELKNSVPKGDRKRKKEVAAEVARLEQELQRKHTDELKNFGTQESVEDQSEELISSHMTNGLQLGNDDDVPKEKTKVSKAQKRREKKSAAAAERESRIAEQAVENLQGARHLEEVGLRSSLNQRGLTLHQIPADGNCLYEAVRHQLSLVKIDTHSSVSDLRALTANQMRKAQDSYFPFLTNLQTGEGLTTEEFEKYCVDLETSNVWGGQIELRALSEALSKPIEVVQASGPSVILGEDLIPEHKPLILSFHRHAYGLGEHYNSVVPKLDGEVTEGLEDNHKHI